MDQDESKITEKEMEYYISELEGYVKVLRSNKEYSNQRLDVLTVTVCGAGIYTSFELMKFIVGSSILKVEQIACLNIHFKITGLLFTIAIIINFLSQWTAYQTATSGIESNKMAVLHAKNLKVDLEKMKDYQTKSDQYNKVTGITNLISIAVMISALLCMMIFIWNLF